MPKKNERTWNFATLHELHVAVNSLLRQAMLNERYKRWKKVIELYEELLWILDLKRFPSEYEPPSSYSMLLYELYFHLGVAYQHEGNDAEAISQFSKSIEVVSIAKNGCLAGCLTNSCLMTPVYARRAFANAKLGSYKLSLRDAEKAVVLDSGSPDVYCIRALVRSTFEDEVLGLKDLESAVKIDPNHVCATMLKASFTKPLFRSDSKQQKRYEILRAKAIRLCQEAETYLTCNSFVHPCILEFYDKFLFPLSVPHTITKIDLTPEKPTQKQLETSYKESPSSRPSSSSTSGSRPSTAPSEVFRCGTTNVATNKRMSLKRRTDYGNAIRKYMSRPKSAEEFFAQLEKQRRYDKIRQRAQSALIRPGDRFARLRSTPFQEAQPETHALTTQARPATAPVGGRVSGLSTILGSPEKTNTSPVTFSPLQGHIRTEGPSIAEKPPRPRGQRKIVINTPENYSIPVFQQVNIKDAPRMYYRPWSGDKLPVSERTPFKYSPAFY